MRALVVVVAAFCVPAAVFAAGGHRIDLTSGEFDGHEVLGRSVADVTAVVGRPDFVSGSRRLRRLGWGRRDSFSFAVLFRPVNGRLRARTLIFESGSARDVSIGDVLRRTPKGLQSVIESKYANAFVLVRSFRCRSAGLCTGEFKSVDSSLHLTFGRTARRGTFLTVWIP